MKPVIRHLATACILLGLSFGALAQSANLKLGYVQIDRIIKESDAAKTGQAQLEQEFSGRAKEVATLEASLKAESAKFQTEAPTLAQEQRSSRQQSLNEQGQTLQRKQRAFQEDLTARKRDVLRKLLDQANVAIRKLSTSEHIDLVLQTAVYVNPKLDITDQVLKSMNAQAPK